MRECGRLVWVLAALLCVSSLTAAQDLAAKNLVQCTAATACTNLTSLCTSCYSMLSDTVPLSGVVVKSDTHLYRVVLCDGQTPFTITLYTSYGNADLRVWNQPDLSQQPDYTSVAHLDPVQSIAIGSDLGIRVYTIGVYNSGLFAAAYTIRFDTTTRTLSRGVTFPHSVNEGCSQYYEFQIDKQKGQSPYNLTAQPDQLQITSEYRGSSTKWPTASNSEFRLYTHFEELKRPETNPALAPNLTYGLVGTARPGRGLGHTVNGQRRFSGYPIKNEFTMLNTNPEYKVGKYYLSVQLKAVSPALFHTGCGWN